MTTLGPLRNSFDRDETEEELKRLFLDLFDAHIAPALADVNVLGMAHLGSLDLIIRAMQADGLALPNRGDANAYAYLYRAWKGRNSGRGLHFLRTFLQLIWPNAWTVDQMMQMKARPYPTALVPRTIFEDSPDAYMTSRIYVQVTAAEETGEKLVKVAPVLRSVLPARFVPRFALGASGASGARVGGIFSGTMILRTAGTLQT